MLHLNFGESNCNHQPFNNFQPFHETNVSLSLKYVATYYIASYIWTYKVCILIIMHFVILQLALASYVSETFLDKTKKNDLMMTHQVDITSLLMLLACPVAFCGKSISDGPMIGK